MKSIIIGLLIYVLGFILVLLSTSIFGGEGEAVYYNAIIFSILYLSAIIGISTSLILNEIKSKR